MLQTLREHSGSWFAKLLFGILVASFALWGVGDVFRSYTSMRPVATVGGHSITQEEYAATLKRMTSQVQQMAKGQLTQDQLRAIGLPKRALDDLISQALIWDNIADLKLAVTEVAIRNHIQSIPAFLNEKGQFDKSVFDSLLQQNGLTESQFIGEVRSNLLKQQLFGALNSGMRLPKFYVMTLFKTLEEKRRFVSVLVPYAKMTVSENPSEADLEQFYKEHKEQFTRPEYRAATLLIMDPKKLDITIPESDVREEFERRRSEFEIPEKRDVKQIIFSTNELAQQGLESLRRGRPMAAVARDLKATFKNLGAVSKQEFPEIAANQVFQLELGKFTDIIETPLGFQIYTVDKIKPAEVPEFETVESKVLDEMRLQRANDKLFEIKNKIEDALAGGSSLAEIAKEYEFQLKKISGVNSKGNDSSGKMALPEDIKAQALEQIFALSEGGDGPVVDTKDGTSFVVHVDKVIPSYIPEFKDITEKVKKAWVENKQYEAAGQLAQSISKEAGSVSGLTKLAGKNKLTIETLEPVSRQDAEKNPQLLKRFTPNLLHNMFGVVTGRSVFGPTKDGVVVVMLQEVLPLKVDEKSKNFDSFNQSIQGLVQRDAASLYVDSLRKKYKVSINQSILDSMIEIS